MEKNSAVTVPTALPRRTAKVTVITRSVTLACCGLALASCGTGHPPDLGDGPTATATAAAPSAPQAQLVGLVAAAQDRHYVAAYTLATHGQPNRTVLAALASDGTWRVDVPGGALDGGADVSIIGTRTGTYQCLLSGAATSLVTQTAPPAVTPSPSGSPTTPPATRYAAPACVKVAAAGHAVPHRYDPVIEHVFTDWLAVLIDRDAPISVSAAKPLPHATGACYSVESNSASLVPPIDPGIFCFTPDGTLTAAALAAGTLTLVDSPAPAPPTTTLPGPVTAGPAAPVKLPASGA